MKASIVEELQRAAQVSRILGFAGYYWLFKTVSRPIDEGGLIAHRISQLLGRRLMEHLEMRVETAGLEKVRGLRRYCVVSNHASYLDWALLLGYFPAPLRFIAKRELLIVPVVGGFLRQHGILIDRKRGIGAVSAIRAAAADESEVPILIFPEGTRSPDGELGPFKVRGLQVLAEARLTMVPVAVSGTYAAFPRHGKVIETGARLKLAVGDPLRPTEHGSLEALIAELRRRIAALVDPSLARGAAPANPVARG